jgi:hypothetical protein
VVSTLDAERLERMLDAMPETAVPGKAEPIGEPGRA